MASTSLLLAKILRWNRSFAVVAATIAVRTSHCHISTAPPPTDSNAEATDFRSSNQKRTVLRNESFAWMRHPYLKQGRRCMCDLEEYEDEAIAKVDMPCIRKEGLKLWFEKEALHFEGVQEREPEWEEKRVPRIFTGIIDIPSGV